MMDDSVNSEWRHVSSIRVQIYPHTPAEGPVLNFDILLHIVFLADTATQSRMMKTCRLLYRNGAREVLRKPHISIYTEKRLISFLRFMHADPTVRMPCLHELLLDIRTGISSDTGRSLANLFLGLGECERPALRYLHLSSSKILFLHKLELSRAVGHLHSLDTVYIDSAGIQAAAVLQLLSRYSALRTASISFCEDLLTFQSAKAERLDPLHLLRYSKNTLTNLEIENWFLVTPTITIYPHMTTLTLSGEWIPATPKLRRAFPNLSRMSIYGGPNIPELEYESRRASNRDDQLIHGTSTLR